MRVREREREREVENERKRERQNVREWEKGSREKRGGMRERGK